MVVIVIKITEDSLTNYNGWFAQHISLIATSNHHLLDVHSGLATVTWLHLSQI